MRHLACTVLLIAVTTFFAACAEEAPAPAQPAAPTAAPAAAPESTPTPAPAEAKPAAAPAPAPASPEDEVLDTEREAPIRKKAEELQAIRPKDLLQRKVGDEVVVLVRGAAGGYGAGAVYGSGPYTLDSSIRTTSIHAGLLQDKELGLLRVKVFAHDGEHPSVEQHGIRPNAWGKYHASYTMEKVDAE